MDVGEVKGLLARVEAASGPDREIDAQIRCVLFAPAGSHVDLSPYNGAWVVYSGVDRGGNPVPCPRPNRTPHELWIAEYTASIDAAFALVERVLPDECAIDVLDDALNEMRHVGWSAKASIPGQVLLWICRALLRALIVRAEAEEKAEHA